MKATLITVILLNALTGLAQLATVSVPPGNQNAWQGETGPDHTVLVPQPAAGLKNSGGNGGHGRVVAVSTGLNYWDGANWSPSLPIFEQNPQDGSFGANRVQHIVNLSHDINVAGAVSVKTGSQILSSTPVGIGLYDPVSGQFLLLATITNCFGTLLSSNQVYYDHAYGGSAVCASLLYTIEQDAISQDVVFTGRLNPADYGFPSDTTRIQIITEFYQPPTPEVLREPVSIQSNPTLRSQMVSPDLFDETLTFGPLVFGAGQAYTLPGSLDQNGEAGLVAKEFVQNADGRYFLIESVPFSSIKQGLLGLPPCGPTPQQGAIHKTSLTNAYVLLPTAPARMRAQTRPSPSPLPARFAQSKPRGVYIDYRATLNSGAILAQSDTTYLVGGTLSCTTLSIEGGCVLKYKVGASITVNTLVCKTSQFRPAICTGVDDDTVGESMSGYSNSGYTGTINSGGYASPAFRLGTQSLSVSGCNFRYAQRAIQYAASSIPSTTINLTHSQLYKCITGIDLLWSGCGSGAGGSGTVAVNLNNTLLANVQNLVNVNSLNTTVNHTLINCTLDQLGGIVIGSGSTLNFNSTNSIYSRITNSSLATFSGQNNGFYNASFYGGSQAFGTPQFIVNTLPFQSVGAGNYYLTDASRYRNAGTSSGVSSSLIVDLGKRTTYAPSIISQTTITTNMVLSPAIGRDTNSTSPGIGYHYDPIDVAFGAVLVTNASVTINPGTVLATFGTNSGAYGLVIGQAGSLNSQGSPTSPVWIAQYNTVQEQPYTNWFQTSAGAISSEFQGLSPGSTNTFRFTSWSMLSQAAPHFNAPTNVGPFNFQDCEFHGGKLLTAGPTINLTNCLLERVYTDLEPKDNQTNYVRNCLALGGNFTLAAANAVVSDNLFDKASITNWNSYLGSLNAYITNNTRLQPTLANDIVLSASPSYQAGPLGNYYQLTNSILINADTNTTADHVGLYHYTVVTNFSGSYEIKETNSLLDLSYHYVAVGTNGLPIDTDGDGLPDYVEDANGNGLWDYPGETDWKDPSPTVSMTSPSNGQLFVTSPTNITISVSAGDNSSVTNVAVYNGTNLLGQISTNGTSVVYTLTWSNVAAGTYTLTATATDNEHATTISAPVVVTVNAMPSVSLTNPVNNAYILLSPTNVTLMATAADSDGSITNVAFYNGTNLLGNVTASPFNFVWSNVPGGTYPLVAKATDNRGAVTTSSTVIVSVDGGLDLGTNNAYVTFGSNTNLDSRTFTIECWFKRNAAGVVTNTGTGGITAVPLVTKGRTANTTGRTNLNYFLGIGTNNVLVADFSDFPKGTNHVVSGITTISNGIWYHAAVAFNGTNLQLYLDGNLEGIISAPELPEFDCLAYAALGTSLDPTGTNAAGFFYGVIDEVRLWSCARSQQQIRTSMSLVDSSDCGLTARWGLDDGQGTTVSNTTSLAANGTIIGSGWSWAASAPYSAAGSVLFIVGSTNLSSGDSAIYNHLLNQGYFITLKSDTNAVSSDGNGKSIILISASVNSTNVNTKFTTNAVPLIAWKPDLYDDLGMVTSNSAFYGSVASQSQLVIIQPGHPLAAGLNGVVNVVSNTGTFAWGAPNSSASLIATTTSNPTNYSIFAYDQGAVMPGLAAPARRVGLFMADDPAMSNLNTNGFALLDAAVNWALTVPCPPKLELMFVMDYTASLLSNSIWGGTLLQEEKNDATYFATNLNLALDRAGVVAFVGTNAGTMSLTPLTNNISAITNAINSLTSPGSYTRIDLGINAAQWQFASNHVAGAQSVVILFSDGLPESGYTNATYAAAGWAKQLGARFISIGLGNYVNTMLMPDMASSLCDYYWEPNITNLPAILSSITNALCRGALDQSPSISITSPTNNSLFLLSPTNISLLAVASDPDGTISKVEFFNGANSIGVATLLSNTTYKLLWTNVVPGTYAVDARATDNSGSTTTSQPITITTYALPSVVITSPTNFQHFLEPTNVVVSGYFIDTNSSSRQVQVYGPTGVVGTATLTGVTNFTFTWSNLLAGSFPVTNPYPVSASLSNYNGVVVPSKISVFFVNPTNPPPFVQITFPSSNMTFNAGSDITLTATATNWDNSVTNVAFFVTTNFIGNDQTAPYSITKCCWSAGSYSLVAIASDIHGATSISPPVSLTVNAAQPKSASDFWDPVIGAAVQLRYVTPYSLAVDASNNLYVADGNFGGGGYDNQFFTNNATLAEWDGKVWSGISGTNNNAATTALKYIGNVLYGGAWSIFDPTYSGLNQLEGVYQINAITNWVLLGPCLLGPTNNVSGGSPCGLASIGSDIFVVGNFVGTTNDPTVQYVAKLSGSNWVSVGNGFTMPTNGTAVRAIASIGNTIYVGGDFTAAGGNTNIQYIAKLAGNTWTNVGVGVNGVVRTLAVCDKNLYAGGDFTSAGGNTNANHIARWDGKSWSVLGQGVSGANDPNTEPWPVPSVLTISVAGNQVFVGGEFTNAFNADGPVAVNNVALATWDEALQSWSWSALDTGAHNVNPSSSSPYVTASALRADPNTNVVDYYIAGIFDHAGSSRSPQVAHWEIGRPAPTNFPTISISAPMSFSVFNTNFSITATASGFGTNYINDFEILIDGSTVYAVNPALTNTCSETYNLDISQFGATVHTITAVAKDNSTPQREAHAYPVYVTFSGTGTVQAQNDFFTVFNDSPAISLNVLANDTSTNHNLLITQVVSVQAPVGSIQVGYDSKSLIFKPSPNTFGTNTFIYGVTDGVSASAAYVTVLIKSKPVISLLSPLDGSQTNISSTIAINGSSFDWDGIVTNVTVFVNGTNVVGQTTNSTFSFVWSNNAVNFYTFLAVATDNEGYTNSSSPATVAITNNSSSSDILTASITNLSSTVTVGNGMYITNYPLVRDGIFDLRGLARDSNTGVPVAYQVLLFRAEDENDPSGVPTPFANVTPLPLDAAGFHQGTDVSGDLGNLDLSLVPNGAYDIHLIVHGSGLQVVTNAWFRLDTQLKIGQFSFSEQDLVLPVNGIPITITRTYNSLNPLSSDFGYSWTFAVNSMDVELDDERQTVTNGTEQALFADEEQDANRLPLNVSIRTGGGWDVTLTLPDGRRTTFAFTPQIGDFTAQAKWTPPPDVHATLTPSGLNAGTIEFLPWLHWADDDTSGNGPPPFDIHDIPGWTLTTQDGTAYNITRGQVNDVYYDTTGNGTFVKVHAYGPPRLSSIVQRTGDTISILTNGVFHYAPNNPTTPTRFALFDRDSQGRIIAVYDPIAGTNGLPAVQYIYHAQSGNLLQVLKLLDRNLGTYATNRYIYANQQFPHYITEIDNGIGVPITRNFYDSSGRLTATEDANNNITQYIHNLTNSMEMVVDPRGNTNSFSYDSRGNVIAITNALKGITLRTYDVNNNKTSETVYTNGSPYAASYFGYDANTGLLLASTNGLGFTNGFGCNSFGQVTNVIDPRGGSWTNYYDPNTGNLTGTSDPLGNTTANFYDPATQLLTGSKDALGTLTTNFYDGSGNLTGTATISTNGTILSTNSFGYDLNGNRTNSTVWRKVGGAWTAAPTAYVYDGQNRVVQTIEPDGGTNIVVFDAAGRQQQTINKLGWPTMYAYDWLDRLVLTTYADSSTNASAYDANGNRIVGYDQLGRATVYAYDALNRLTTTAFADLTTNLTVFDDLGRVRFSIDARGVTNAFGYDQAGRRIAVTNAWGTAAQMTNGFVFDGNGNQTAFINGLGRTTSYTFDALNRQTVTSFPDNTKQIAVYDAANRRIGEVDQSNITNWFTYDGVGRLTAVTNALGSAQYTWGQYQYDEAGNLTAQVDALNRTTSFAYDSMGRRTKRTLPGLQAENLGYDLAGNLIRYTNFNSVVITNQFDVLNRLTNRASVVGYQVAFVYTNTGQRIKMTDPSGTYAYYYDSRDRLLTNVTLAGTLSYTYDGNGNVTSISSSTANGTSVTYQYDALNRLTNVVDARLTGGAQNSGYGFDNAGNLQRIAYANGVTHFYQYDPLNRLTNIAWNLGGSALGSFAYQLGAAGNRTNMVEVLNGVTRTNRWIYDSLYRVTTEAMMATSGGSTNFWGTNSYSYDAAGNRLTRSVSGTGGFAGLTNQALNFDNSDRLDNDSNPSTPSTWFDPNGNTTNYGGSFQYDVENRLTNANSGAVLIYYNGDGQRVKKVVSGVTTLYLVDTRNPSGYSQVLEELSSSNNLTCAYTFGLSLISQRTPNVATNFYGSDGLGSIRFLLTPAGAVANTYAYDAFGDLIASTGSLTNNYRHDGERYDPELGSYDDRARERDQNIGRFMSLDPVEGDLSAVLSRNAYIFCANNPVNCIDLTGLKTYLVCYGEDTTSLFEDGAKAHAQGIKRWKGFDSTKDTVVIVKTYTVSDLEKALHENRDIAWIAYIGHGGTGALYLGIPSGADYNLSPFGGAAGDASDSTAISFLPTENVRKDAKAALFSCYSAAADSGQGSVSMAQAFADRFSIPVLGAGAGVGFNKSGPYIKRWRIVEGWRERIFKGLHHGGGWQIVNPDSVSVIP